MMFKLKCFGFASLVPFLGGFVTCAILCHVRPDLPARFHGSWGQLVFTILVSPVPQALTLLTDD